MGRYPVKFQKSTTMWGTAPLLSTVVVTWIYLLRINLNWLKIFELIWFKYLCIICLGYFCILYILRSMHYMYVFLQLCKQYIVVKSFCNFLLRNLYYTLRWTTCKTFRLVQCECIFKILSRRTAHWFSYLISSNLSFKT